MKSLLFLTANGSELTAREFDHGCGKAANLLVGSPRYGDRASVRLWIAITRKGNRVSLLTSSPTWNRGRWSGGNWVRFWTKPFSKTGVKWLVQCLLSGVVNWVRLG